jgi:hypothetical protein
LRYINIKVEHKKADLITPIDIICDNNDYVVNFTFDSEWDNHPHKTARFSYNGKYDEVVFEGDTCIAPPIHDAKGVFVGVYSGDMSTTSPVLVPCVPSILTLGGEHADPPKDVYLQLLDELNRLQYERGSEASNDTPLMNGEGSAGSSGEFARGDHVHPTDTTRASAQEVEQLSKRVTEGFETVAEEIEKLDVPSMKTDIQNAVNTSNEAKSTADKISGIASSALNIAGSALSVSQEAKEESSQAKKTVDDYKAIVDKNTEDIAAETERATKAEGENATAIASETERATKAEEALSDDIAAMGETVKNDILPKIVNANYTEKDSNNPSFIENRPFYRDVWVEADEVEKGTFDFSFQRDPDGVIYKFSDRTISRDELFAEGAEYKVEGQIQLADIVYETFILRPECIVQEYESGIIISVRSENRAEYTLYVVYDHEKFSVECYEGIFTPPTNGIYYYQRYDSTINRIYREEIVDIKQIDKEFIDLTGHPDFVALGEEVETAMGIAKGAHRAFDFPSISSMITSLNAESKDTYGKPDNLYIIDTKVPDFWVVSVVNESTPYTYTNDESLVADLTANGVIRAGHYVLAQLESSVPHLENYVKKTDYAWIKQGVAYNDQTLTDEEKANAQTWLGAVPRVDSTGLMRVYGISGNGSQTTYQVITNAGNIASGRLPRYVANTTSAELPDYTLVLSSGIPLLEHHVTNKKYVDNLPDKLTLDDAKRAKWQTWLGLEEYLDVFHSNGTVGLEYSVGLTTALCSGLGDATETEIEIASKFRGRAVTGIDGHAFKDCTSLIGVTMPDSIVEIEEAAFYGCASLISVTISKSVTSIGNYAFQDCASLTSIVIPDSVTSIGTQAFANCTSITSVVIPDGVTSIGNHTFNSCKNLTSITIPDSVTSIGDYAFVGCKITDVYYKGTEEEWVAITIGTNNEKLINATIHYNIEV